ncbi:glycosyltransferase family 4 protein [Shinella zoogloeoides]|uniref:glycosyltransferase family 4 protein n=1 Tax=Shinella zoogloeoides TaxID=352475 RepID=UPI001F564A29|nr:glycosyltransferase family 4 protein [Shinella zoogloeoides]
MTSIAIIGNQAFSLINFRGPLITDMVARGHTVYALAPEIDNSAKQALRQLGAQPVEITLSRTGTNPLADLTTLVSLWRSLVKIKPNLILAYAAKPVIYGTIAAWLAGVPHCFAMIEGLGYVFMARPDDGFAKRGLRRLVKGLYRFSLQRAKRIFFLNDDDIADFTRMNLALPQKAVKLGGIGVDLGQWRSAPPVLAPVTFTLVARLLRDKGVVEFVEAARLIRMRNPQIRFLLVGGRDSNPESVSEAELSAWVADGSVEWTGHVPVRPWLEQTSVFVLPSFYREGVPRSIQEAMAMARPIITTDWVGCRETVIEGRNGFLVPPRDASSLADAMQHFIDNPALIVEMGRQSRILAEERFDVKAINARMMEIMEL